MEKINQTTPVLIIGAGPTGLTMAVALTLQNIPCRIIDKLEAPTDQSRAAGIHARTLEIFNQLGIVNDVIKQGVQAHAIALYAGEERIAHLDYTQVDSPYKFVTMLPQADTEIILTKRLQELSITVERGVELISFVQNQQGTTAELRDTSGKKETVNVSYLLGCDGAHSVVRKTLNFPFVGETIKENWILGDLEATWDEKEDELHIFLSQNGIFMIFPLGDKRFRIAADHRAPEVNKDQEPTKEEFQLLADAYLKTKITLGKVHWLSLFRINYRKVAKFHEGCVFLSGDAAHIHSPAGGQGMNTGIQDAFNLAWKLALVIKGEADASLLESYSLERNLVAENVLKDTKRLTQLVTLKNPLFKQLRNKLMPIITQLGAVQHAIIAKMSEVDICYKNTPSADEDWQGSSNNAYSTLGSRAPNMLLTDLQSNTTINLYDLIKPLKHHALFFLKKKQHLDDAKKLIDYIQDQYNSKIKMFIITDIEEHVADLKQCYQSKTILLDHHNQITKQYNVNNSAFYLIRPDGYISYRNQPISLTDCIDYFDGLYLS